MIPTHVLITGAAGAIGSSLARGLRAAWPTTRLALLDRDAGALGALAAELAPASAHGVDLADAAALEAVVAALPPLDGLVNCAGVMWVGEVATMAWAEAGALLAIDLLAPLRLQALVAGALVARGAPGVIVNIASMAGKVPIQGCAYYGAAKAGLAMASEIAHAELAPHGVHVLTVYPGPIRSPLEQQGREALGGTWFGGAMRTGEPDALARAIVDGIATGAPRVIYPAAQRLGFVAPGLAGWAALRFGPKPGRGA